MKRKFGVALLALTTGLAFPLSASAHVPVTPNVAAAGTKAELTFTVPNESATAGTVKVEIDLPTNTPFGSVDYQPVNGWQATVKVGKLANPIVNDGDTITEAPVSITFTADPGVKISEGQFQNFVLSVDPVPDTGKVLLPVHQTYSDGTVVDWTDPTPASGEEPEHPAPTLYINDAPPAADVAAGLTVKASKETPSENPLPLVLSSAALLLAFGGLVLGAIAVARQRKN